ncbi:MAG: hypothetical protein J0M12_09970 [Deltaproteobacteria bacterium]|nr:hypothetical protein [Deltaproteobacteria bacterium]
MRWCPWCGQRRRRPMVVLGGPVSSKVAPMEFSPVVWQRSMLLRRLGGGVDQGVRNFDGMGISLQHQGAASHPNLNFICPTWQP